MLKGTTTQIYLKRVVECSASYEGVRSLSASAAPPSTYRFSAALQLPYVRSQDLNSSSRRFHPGIPTMLHKPEW